jgi:hypothetical protein
VQHPLGEAIGGEAWDATKDRRELRWWAGRSRDRRAAGTRRAHGGGRQDYWRAAREVAQRHHVTPRTYEALGNSQHLAGRDAEPLRRAAPQLRPQRGGGTGQRLGEELEALAADRGAHRRHLIRCRQADFDRLGRLAQLGRDDARSALSTPWPMS